MFTMYDTVWCRYNVVQYNTMLHVAYNTAVLTTERKPHFELTMYTPYVALMGESWGVYCVCKNKCVLTKLPAYTLLVAFAF